MYSINCFIVIVMSLYGQISALSNHPHVNDDQVTRENFALFYCYKLKSCTPGGNKVCGFDDTQASLAEFEDLCTLYKVNCEMRGLYRFVEALICEGQKKYLAETNDFLQRNVTKINKSNKVKMKYV